MNASSLPAVRITGGFWGRRLEVNARQAIFHQWKQLEQTRCTNNFRLAAGRGEGFREGLFFADSDAYKWLDAASRLLAFDPDPTLVRQVDEFIDLLAAAQTPDGYLYTYNQIHFPGRRWVNLQTEHELYCLGHLIEAAIAHNAATGSTRLLSIGRRAADLLVRELMDAGPLCTDGHEEIEIALLRLQAHTGEANYLELARRLLERRGRILAFPLRSLVQLASTGLRWARRNRLRAAYIRQHPEWSAVRLLPGNPAKHPRGIWLRSLHDFLSGRNTQQHAPLRAITEPVGHAVRFTYLETAATMLARQSGDASLRPVLEAVWEHMVTRRMYVTGGIGALPLIEGFGHDYELDPEVAYAETCAALGCMLWNRELALLTGQAKYDDLCEWQLYNAAAVGISVDGRSYLYNNPLVCTGEVTRRSWYHVPCCPSNISRVWASLGDFQYSWDDSELRVHHYFSSRADLPIGRVEMDSGLPWDGRLRLHLSVERPVRLALRIPSWAGNFAVRIDGELAPSSATALDPLSPLPESACGYVPHAARWLRLQRAWRPGQIIELDLEMPIRLHYQDRRVPRVGGQAAVSRGPLVYCLESPDNGPCVFNRALEVASLSARHSPELCDGIWTLHGRGAEGEPLIFIPYMFWGNRGASQMSVFVKAAGRHCDQAC